MFIAHLSSNMRTKQYDMKSTFTYLFFILACSISVLQAQQVAIVGMNWTDTEGWSFVALQDIPSGTDIYFTDEEYDAANNRFNCSSNNCTTGLDNLVHWEAVGQLDKGCVVFLKETASNTLTITASPGCNGGTVTTIDPAISTLASEPIYAFSSAGDPTDPNPQNEQDIMNMVTEIHSVIYQGSSLGNFDPIADYPNVVRVLAGVGTAQEYYVEYTASRLATVTTADIENIGNYTTTALGNNDLDLTAFSDIDLPVELLTFDIEVERNGFLLSWSTANEINNAGFEVERSEDGRDFEPIAWVDGYGDSNQERNYLFKDENVRKGQVYYYRLKQVDYNGHFEYFNVLNAALPSDNTTVGEFFPNPVVVGASTINFFALTEGEWSIRVFSAAGQLVAQEQRQLIEGKNVLDFDFSNLEAGLFIVQFANGEEQIQRKVAIKQ